MNTTDNNLFDMDNNIWDEEEFRTVIEDHLEFLKNNPNNSVITVKPSEAKRYEYDFYNLLRIKAVDHRLHWVVLRMNGRIDPFAKCSDIENIIVPNFNDISTLLSYHKTKSV